MSSMQTTAEPLLVSEEPNNAQEIRNARATISNFVATRRRTIKSLRQIAETADHIEQSCGINNRNASIVGMVGGGSIAAAGVVTIASDGLAAQMVIGGLATMGAVCSVGAWSSKNYDRGQRLTQILADLIEVLAEDAEAVNSVKIILTKIKNGDFGDPMETFREVHMFLAEACCIGITVGSTTALKELDHALSDVSASDSRPILKVIRKMLGLIPKALAASEGMEAVADDAGAAAVKSMPDGLSKDFAKRQAVKAAKEAYTRASMASAPRVGDEAAGKVTEMAGEGAASKDVKEAATKAAEETATQAAKTARRVTGTVTMLFGIGTAFWEAYNAYQYHLSSKKDSELGTELRALANELENAPN